MVAPSDPEEISPRKLSKKIILLHDNARPHTADMTKVTLATMGWEIITDLPYSPDLALSDFSLFGPMKVHLGGPKFQTGDELKLCVLNWRRSQGETFRAAGVSNLPVRRGESLAILACIFIFVNK
jgi:hypothetical protein